MTYEELQNKLSHPAQRALANAGISSLEQLAHFSEKEIARLHGIGGNALEKIKSALQESGLHFRKD